MLLLNKKLWALLSAMLILSFTACSDDDSDSPINSGKESSIEALVLNQGSWSKNLGSISVVYRNGMVNPDIFRQVNNRPLGDVAQSIEEINGKYFVTLSNSKKIEIIAPESFRSLGTILYPKEGNPQQIVAISDNEAIVSDIKNQLVRIKTVAPYDKPLEYISIPSAIQYMAVLNNKLFGLSKQGLYVFDLDRINAQSVRQIPNIKSSEETSTCKMLVDKNKKLWVLMNEKDGIVLKCVDPIQEKSVASHKLPFVSEEDIKPGDVWAGVSYNRTDIDPTLTWIYFNVQTCTIKSSWSGVSTQQSVYRMNVETGKFELYRDVPGISMMYGFGVNSEGDVFICDCLDYSSQRGYLRKFKKDEMIISYRVGIYPAQVYFPKTK